ncbi:glycosyltransferase family 32 protein [Lacticaseibacillus chiayiensis]|uniref:glycosyltransferase family 32 protein n=1 Tax=Lacticaseibacillus chiayiensis TaxID=2100821 RepID=UPI003C782591
MEKFPFAKRAFEERQWAFVSDLIRAAVIYEYGGVYLDTDVKVIKDLSGFLKNRSFLVGFQDKEHPFTATFGAEPKHPLLKNVLDFYDSIPINDSF